MSKLMNETILSAIFSAIKYVTKERIGKKYYKS